MISFDTIGKIVTVYWAYKIGKFCFRVMNENQDLKAEIKKHKPTESA